MPKPPIKLKNSSYRTLLARIQREMEHGVQTIKLMVERQKVVTSWTIGRHIHHHLRQNPPPYGGIGHFYNQLSKDLDINARTLCQFEQFYRYFSKLDLKENLTWSHYRALINIPDEKERLRWIERIKRENINSENFRLLLTDSHQPKTTGIKLKEPQRGTLYTYKLIHADGFKGFKAPWFVDCGFTNRIEAPPAQATLDNKRLYTSLKTENGYRLKVAVAVVDEIYTFKAKVIRVIDADTLLTDIDQGFSIWTEQRLRLKGIDAPEVDTLAGKKAKKWVEKEIGRLPFIIVKTYKSDKFDRYLTDVFYSKKENDPQKVASSGQWLNGRLVELGLAVPWEP